MKTFNNFGDVRGVYYNTIGQAMDLFKEERADPMWYTSVVSSDLLSTVLWRIQFKIMHTKAMIEINESGKDSLATWRNKNLIRSLEKMEAQLLEAIGLIDVIANTIKLSGIEEED